MLPLFSITNYFKFAAAFFVLAFYQLHVMEYSVLFLADGRRDYQRGSTCECETDLANDNRTTPDKGATGGL
jgi:hypothetical protein